MTLDVKNAFNSLRWNDVLYALEHRFHVPEYLLRMIRDYLSERVLTYDTTEGPRERLVSAGAAQRSNLGPDLWNVAYDGILRLVIPSDPTKYAFLVACAAIIIARTIVLAQLKLNQMMRRASG